MTETTSNAPRTAAPRTLAILAAVLLASAAVPPAQAQVPPAPHADSAALTAPKRPTSPAPRSASREEAEHRKRIDAVIAPVLQTAVSADDLAAVKQAFAAISAGDIAKATGLRSGISDATAKKLVVWYALSRGFGAAAEYREFLDKNPTWPQRWLLQQRMEESLFTRGGAAADIIGYLTATPPATSVGEAALASAHLAQGDKDKARAIAAKVWRDGDLPATLEAGFIERFGSLLTPADHRWRLDRLLMSDRRWNDGRKAQSAYIRRMLPLLSPEERKKAEARLAVYMRSSAADKMVAELPADAKTDWGLVFQRIQLARRKGNDAAAIKMLLEAPTDAAKIVSPDDWWDERRALAYEALEKGNARLAYDLVKDAGALTVNPLKEQRFMAGWLAMRHLKDVGRAEKHFRAMREVADGPLSRAKGDYWIGRALEAKGQDEEARTFYQRAAGERDTFHALLARQKLKPGDQTLEIAPPAMPTDEEVRTFRTLDSLAGAVIAKKAGLGGDVIRPFLANSRTATKSEAWSGLIAHLADALGDTQMSLRIAKTALGDGHNLLIYSYPLGAFPSYEPLRDPPELAMLLGIARQETEFNMSIVSGAGARGLLQVMPITARHVCKDHNIKCDIPRLLTDKTYNTMIGSAYIGDRMGEFDGSYVLTLAGYNAGPGRARQWIREFGDPRSGKIDPIDWIERIPFEETREYVGKVLSNVQIYRARIGQQPALRLNSDLGLAQR